MSDHRLPKSPRALKDLLESRGLRLTKKRGQNFLVDTNVLEGIADDAALQGGELVLEIGPGAGALTEYLLDLAGVVVALDVDQGMVALLGEFLQDRDRLLLCEGDVMGAHNQLNPELIRLLDACTAGQALEANPLVAKTCSSASLAEVAGKALCVVANLPYSITSPVILALLEAELPIQQLTLLVQLEVAEKICADVGEGDWGLLSLLVRLHGEAEILRKVSRHVFWPAPQVDSALIRITPRQGRSRQEIQALKAVVAPIFRYRRKSLSAGIKHAHGLKGDAIARVLDAAQLSASDHIEKLGLEELKRLQQAFEAEAK
ncbi:MAG: ribosomal RNA small subunit methyltransferase A [Planctomycetes bacterium]|nr:ribosomal RNA small subunit methyltransferase A [Planctomycetota bacterium]